MIENIMRLPFIKCLSYEHINIICSLDHAISGIHGEELMALGNKLLHPS